MAVTSVGLISPNPSLWPTFSLGGGISERLVQFEWQKERGGKNCLTHWLISSSITDVLIRHVSQLFQSHRGGASASSLLVLTQPADWLVCFSAYRHKYHSLPLNILWITHSRPTGVFQKPHNDKLLNYCIFFKLCIQPCESWDTVQTKHVIWIKYLAAHSLLSNISFNFHPMVTSKNLEPPRCHLLTHKPYFPWP